MYWRDCDPKDTAGNIDRLKDAGWEAPAAQQEAVLHREAHKRGPLPREPASEPTKAKGSAFLAQAVDLSDLLRDGVPEPTYLPSPTLW